MKNIVTSALLSVAIWFLIPSQAIGQSASFTENFESGVPNDTWGIYWPDEENVTAVAMGEAPAALDGGGDYVGYIQDADGTYNGAAVILGGDTTMQNYSIEGDVYCYVNHPGGSAYTGLIAYGDSAAGIYIKLVADFDADQRMRLYNNKIDNTTFQYSFSHSFTADDVPGGIPADDGWHHMKVEVKTISEDTTAYWCYFDGEMLAGCPVYDTSEHQLDSGKFGIYAFQMDADGIAGYFDNIVVSSATGGQVVTDVQQKTLADYDATIPQESRLDQNFPNPFNPETSISYRVLTNEHVNLTVFDMLGRNIRTLVSEQQMPGYYTVSWDGRDYAGSSMPSGVYVYVLKTPSFREVRKMLMVK